MVSKLCLDKHCLDFSTFLFRAVSSRSLLLYTLLEAGADRENDLREP